MCVCVCVCTDPLKAASSPAYWRFSVNELGELDISAMMRRIDEIKRLELPPDKLVGFEFEFEIMHRHTHTHTCR